MRRLQCVALSLLVVMIFSLLYLYRRVSNSTQGELQRSPTLVSSQEVAKTQLSEWKNCILQNVSPYEHDEKELWSHLGNAVEPCEKLPFMVNLPMQDFQDINKTNRHISSPQNTPSIVVSLGVGRDTVIEEALIKVLPKGTMFYGADPIAEINDDLYMRFGTFFPFAIGSKSKISRARVYINDAYFNRNAAHIEFAFFLSAVIGHKVYDNILIDVEGAEYELLPYFYRDGELDRKGITVCQFNIKVHNPNDAQKEMFRKFIFRIIHDNRYAFFRVVEETQLYFLNFSDPFCVSKYVAGRSS